MSDPTKPDLTAKTPDDQVTWGGWPINRETAQAIGCPPGLSGIALPITSAQIDAGQISYRHPRAEDIGEAIRRAIFGPPTLQIHTAVSIGPGHSIISDAELDRLRKAEADLAADLDWLILQSDEDESPWRMVFEELDPEVDTENDFLLRQAYRDAVRRLRVRSAQATTEAAGKDGQK